MHLQKKLERIRAKYVPWNASFTCTHAYFGGYTLSTAVANIVCRARERMIVHVKYTQFNKFNHQFNLLYSLPTILYGLQFML
jgi:hypothetical protein